MKGGNRQLLKNERDFLESGTSKDDDEEGTWQFPNGKIVFFAKGVALRTFCPISLF